MVALPPLFLFLLHISSPDNCPDFRAKAPSTPPQDTACFEKPSCQKVARAASTFKWNGPHVSLENSELWAGEIHAPNENADVRFGKGWDDVAAQTGGITIDVGKESKEATTYKMRSIALPRTGTFKLRADTVFQFFDDDEDPIDAVFEPPAAAARDFSCPENWIEEGPAEDCNKGRVPPCYADTVEFPSGSFLVQLTKPVRVANVSMGCKGVNTAPADSEPFMFIDPHLLGSSEICYSSNFSQQMSPCGSFLLPGGSACEHFCSSSPTCQGASCQLQAAQSDEVNIDKVCTNSSESSEVGKEVGEGSAIGAKTNNFTSVFVINTVQLGVHEAATVTLKMEDIKEEGMGDTALSLVKSYESPSFPSRATSNVNEILEEMIKFGVVIYECAHSGASSNTHVAAARPIYSVMSPSLRCKPGVPCRADMLPPKDCIVPQNQNLETGHEIVTGLASLIGGDPYTGMNVRLSIDKNNSLPISATVQAVGQQPRMQNKDDLKHYVLHSLGQLYVNSRAWWSSCRNGKYENLENPSRVVDPNNAELMADCGGVCGMFGNETCTPPLCAQGSFLKDALCLPCPPNHACPGNAPPSPCTEREEIVGGRCEIVEDRVFNNATDVNTKGKQELAEEASKVDEARHKVVLALQEVEDGKRKLTRLNDSKKDARSRAENLKLEVEDLSASFAPTSSCNGTAPSSKCVDDQISILSEASHAKQKQAEEQQALVDDALTDLNDALGGGANASRVQKLKRNIYFLRSLQLNYTDEAEALSDRANKLNDTFAKMNLALQEENEIDEKIQVARQELESSEENAKKEEAAEKEAQLALDRKASGSSSEDTSASSSSGSSGSGQMVIIIIAVAAVVLVAAAFVVAKKRQGGAAEKGSKPPEANEKRQAMVHQNPLYASTSEAHERELEEKHQEGDADVAIVPAQESTPLYSEVIKNQKQTEDVKGHAEEGLYDECGFEFAEGDANDAALADDAIYTLELDDSNRLDEFDLDSDANADEFDLDSSDAKADEFDLDSDVVAGGSDLDSSNADGAYFDLEPSNGHNDDSTDVDRDFDDLI